MVLNHSARDQMSALSTLIASAKPREKAGSRTGARYAFQAHVSLAKLLDLHETGADYRAIFDLHDDLTILDNSGTPNLADFFQIKGKETGRWTAGSFCKQGKDPPRTVVGKMFHHTATFGAAANSATFLTNASYDFELADGTKTTPDHVNIPLAQLGAKDQAALVAALEIDFPSPRTRDEATFISFARTNVPVKAYDLLLKGQLVDILAGKDGVVVGAAYTTLIEDIIARANSTYECATLEEVFAHKSLSRGELQSVLDAAMKRDSILDNWAVIDDEQKAAGRNYSDRIKLKTAAVEYLQGRSKRLRDVSVLATALKAAGIAAEAAVLASSGLREASGAIRAEMPKEHLQNQEPLVLEAALLVEAFEVLNG